MDHIERRGRILVALPLNWYLHMIVQHMFDMQTLALNTKWENALVLSICFEDTKMSIRSEWAFERNVRLNDWLLLGSFTKKCSSKTLVYVTIHSSFFVRGEVHVCRGRIHM